MMTQAGYLQARRMSPTALAAAIIIEGAIIAAAVTWQIEAVTGKRPTVVDAIWVQPEKPAEPHETVKPKPEAHTQIQPREIIVAEKPIIDLTPLGPGVTETSDRDSGANGTVATGTTEGPLIVDEPRIEPAKAKGNIRDLIKPEDYPDSALRREETGTVRARLTIGPAGNVTGCAVVASSGSTALDSATCKVLKARARFTPAKDSNGNAVADSYVTPQIVWRLDG